LLAEEKVAVAPGRTFGRLANRYVRVSLAAAEEELERGLEKLCSYIRRRRQIP
jgi:aspartate/methionine/tyrosine aminotransferase